MQEEESKEKLNKLTQELDQVKKESEDRLNSWKRSAADFENYKKRRAKEDQELVNYSKQLVLLNLLPILEALDQGLKHVPESGEHTEWSKGIKDVLKRLEKSMQDMGIKKIKTVGELYNHELHEAVEVVEGEGKSGEIIEEVADGYEMEGRVIRPAKVKVRK